MAGNDWTELARLSAEATQGPWISFKCGGVHRDDPEATEHLGCDRAEDAAFIAAARNFLTPERIRLLRAAEELAEAVDRDEPTKALTKAYRQAKQATQPVAKEEG